MNKPIITDQKRITRDILGELFANVVQTHFRQDGCIVLLTQELAEHIVDMYYATDWRSEQARLSSIILPEHIFTGECDTKEWYTHVGEHIYISVFGEPWEDIMNAPQFIDDVEIRFLDDFIDLATWIFDDMQNQDCLGAFLHNVTVAVQMLSCSGASEAEMKRRLLSRFNSVAK